MLESPSLLDQSSTSAFELAGGGSFMQPKRGVFPASRDKSNSRVESGKSDESFRNPCQSRTRVVQPKFNNNTRRPERSTSGPRGT